MIYIHEKLKIKLNQSRLGYLKGTATANGKFDINEMITKYLNFTDLDNQIKVNTQTRNAYKSLGKQPSRYRPSAEALIRRLQKGGALSRINDFVDIINYMSVSSGFSISLFDFTKIKGSITLDIGDQSHYDSIGRGRMNIENLPCLFDDLGAFGNPSSDSDRTKVSNNTKSILMVIYEFESHSYLPKTLDRSESFLKKYCNFSYNVKGIC
jgi:DNA/RNA-binding domain of Phe-tRNA-synthetase-like protein